ncbi:hypothetical protein R6Q57_014298 [Mikania cordata]
MDSIISSIITPVVGSLMAPIKKHLGFLVSSTKHVTDMKEKMAQLNLTEQDTRQKWEEAVARNHEVSHHVSPWLEEVKKMNQKVQSIPTGGIECFNMAKRYKVGKQSYNILVEIQALETWRLTFEFTNTQKPLAMVVSTPTRPSIDGTQNNDCESRDLIRKVALKSLQTKNDESHKMIALCRMGGVGKTTMMEHIKKDVEASKMFDCLVKVVLGENVDAIALQRDIAKYINLEDLKEEAKDARADRLRSIFEGMSQQGKKVLAIMDDLWKVFDLKDVGLSPLPNGFKLLFTSRDRRVCTQMGVRNDSIFDVGFLNYKEAKTLFFRVVGLSDGDDPPLQKIGEDIVKKCGGLPIVIVTIAKSLTNNIQEAWKKALWRLEQDDLKDLEEITHIIFEMSYENLKDDNDRENFLLSGLCPDDFDIRIEDLLRNISTSNCDAMSILIPWYAVGQMKRLEELKIWNCKTITKTTFPASSSDVAVSKGTPCSFHNLIEIKMIFKYIETLIPSNVLLQLQKLEKIHLEICYKLKEVFEVVALEESDFNESQTTIVQIPNLKQVKLDSAYDLKYLWNSNRSMVLEFPNLTTVSIEYCERLEHVFTCSMVGSLVQLQDLRITSCQKIEVIVKEQEESEAKMMVLPRLKSLKLDKLGSFKGFCLGTENFSLPLLDSLFRYQRMPRNYGFH